MTFFVDRFEGCLAVVQREDGVPGAIPRDALPPLTREGSVLIYENGAYRLDERRERARRKKMSARLKNLIKP